MPRNYIKKKIKTYTPQDVAEAIQKTPFKNNVPGPDWFINFRKRHRLSIKKAQAVEFVRRKMTDPFVIAEYFDLLENTLRDFNLFESPQVIWNLDETSMCLDPSRTKVVGQINKPCARTTHGTGKENITVLTGASAIVSNILIKKASQPSSESQASPQQTCTFEELVLRKIQQDKKVATSTKKKRVTKGTELITATMAKTILEEIEKSKRTKLPTKKGKTDKKKPTKISTKNDSTYYMEQNQDERPCTSGIKNKNKRKRKPSLDSITSVSDIMSEHSDSDIFYVEESSDENFEEYYEEKKMLENKTKDVEGYKNICEKITDKTNKAPYSYSGKDKGVGKKTKGKENQINTKDKTKEEKRLIESKTGKYSKTQQNSTNKEDKEIENERVIENKHEYVAGLPLEEENQSKKENPTVNEFYKLNDAVLIRYIIRNKWKYFIGFIEEVKEHEYFSINFLKTVKKQQQLIFVTPKRKDIDDVPEKLIVKKIDIRKSNEKEYFLCNDEDSIYFD
ncbi:unnamed protein product [Euphydryas editha]|uniref:HTH CENPB-type domain-containing protein n=1 Tax=Euphydryas editha TaxID=104508 RepID=A0AAU9UI98_EUPED|nr:unnamed protein product [Euphydryas editha]